MVVNNMRVDEFFNVDKKSMDYYEIKAINHLIANCNSALTQIGLYLFGKLEMPERIPIKGASINLVGADEYVRRGMLKTLEEKLMNYRKMLLDNGGDLPLNLVLEKTRTDRKESFIKSRAEYLESVKGRPLTVAERAEQGELWERSQQATTAELVREMDELKKNGNKGTGG
jgi:hypothetical protein